MSGSSAGKATTGIDTSQDAFTPSTAPGAESDTPNSETIQDFLQSSAAAGYSPQEQEALKNGYIVQNAQGQYTQDANSGYTGNVSIAQAYADWKATTSAAATTYNAYQTEAIGQQGRDATVLTGAQKTPYQTLLSAPTNPVSAIGRAGGMAGRPV
jgi:hypothetical protein